MIDFVVLVRLLLKTWNFEHIWQWNTTLFGTNMWSWYLNVTDGQKTDRRTERQTERRHNVA